MDTNKKGFEGVTIADENQSNLMWKDEKEEIGKQNTHDTQNKNEFPK